MAKAKGNIHNPQFQKDFTNFGAAMMSQGKRGPWSVETNAIFDALRQIFPEKIMAGVESAFMSKRGQARMRIDLRNIETMLKSAGADLKTLRAGGMIPGTNYPMPTLKSIASEIGKLNSDMGMKKGAANPARRAQYMARLAKVVEHAVDASTGQPDFVNKIIAAGDDPSKVRALYTSATEKVKGLASAAKSGAKSALVPSGPGNWIASVVTGLGVQGALDKYGPTAQRKLRNAVAENKLNLDDMIAEFEMQDALSRRAGRVQSDFPNVAAFLSGGAGAPSAQPGLPAGDPRASADELFLPAGSPQEMSGETAAMMSQMGG